MNELSKILTERVYDWLLEKPLDTNQIFLKSNEMMFRKRIVSDSVDLLGILLKNFKFTDEKYWAIYDKPKIQTIR